MKWPDYQYEYGQGTLNKDKSGKFYYSYGASEDGVNTGSTSSAFGPKFNGQSYFQYDPNIIGPSLERQLWRPYKITSKASGKPGKLTPIICHWKILMTKPVSELHWAM